MRLGSLAGGCNSKAAIFPRRYFSAGVNTKSYGSGVAGDLFVHLFQWNSFRLPVRLDRTSRWPPGGSASGKMAGDEPDVLIGLYDYPQAFNVDAR